ncbi:hypothetical protein ACFL5N_02040, partial [bacterium]
MKKIINLIVLCVFVSALFSNYSSAHDLPKSSISNQHLKLVSSFMKGKIKDDLFDNFHKAIEKVSGKSGWELARQIEDVYSGLKNACNEIKDVEFKTKDLGEEINLEVRIKTKSRIYKNEIIIEKESGIIWDKIDFEIKDLCKKLKTKKTPYIYLRLIKNRLYDYYYYYDENDDCYYAYYDNEELNYSDKEILFLVLETITPKIIGFRNERVFSRKQEQLFFEYLRV